MAAPNAVADKAWFFWPDEPVYDQDVPRDAAGRPYNLTAETASNNTHEEVQVNVAVEHVERSPHGTALGQIDSPRIVITMLDEDYALVIGAIGVRLGGNDYEIDYWAPPNGLFGVDVFTAYAHARDES